jgi:3-oxoacyl-[acyl-carrier-protein] synthase-3
MATKISTVITGTGKYIPENIIKNSHFLKHKFCDINGVPLPKTNQEIIDKFEEITTIAERRYVNSDMLTSDMGYLASLKAIEDAGIDKEELDYILVAHNFGDVREGNIEVDIVPTLASRIKYKLGIENPFCVAYDVPFGCPGWLQAFIQADYFIKSGDAKKILVIGAETLSRVVDPHDIDGMIYADGAGATIVEARQSDTKTGVLAHLTRTDTVNHMPLLVMGRSNDLELRKEDKIYIKMQGRKVYLYAISEVPNAIKMTLEKANRDLSEVKQIFIHQANGKMDDAMVERLYKMYKLPKPEFIMPMTVQELGNTSVATIPTLLDIVRRNEKENYNINEGDLVVFASVGAGMNINAMAYQF